MPDFTFTWRGSALQIAKRAGEAAGAEKTRAEIEDYLKATLHRVTGQMARESFAVVHSTDQETVLQAGSDAGHTVYHELGTSNFVGHPQLRATQDAYGERFAASVVNGIRSAIGGG
jgi:hypothetical protein